MAIFCLLGLQVSAQECNLEGKEIFSVAEQPPVFGYCDQLVMTKQNSYECSDQNVRAYIEQQLEEKNIEIAPSQNPIIVEVIISDSGDVCNTSLPLQSRIKQAKIIQDIVFSMPDWRPAQQNDRPVFIRIQISYNG